MPRAAAAGGIRGSASGRGPSHAGRGGCGGSGGWAGESGGPSGGVAGAWPGRGPGVQRGQQAVPRTLCYRLRSQVAPPQCGSGKVGARRARLRLRVPGGGSLAAARLPALRAGAGRVFGY